MRTARVTRVLRGTLAATVATFVALLSHVVGGGAVPGGIGILLPFVLSLAVCTLLAGRRLSFGRLAIAVGVSQLLFHALFVLGTFAPSAAPVATGHHHHGVAALAPMTDATASVALLHADATMWVGHAIAAVVTTALLYRGERAALRLGALAVELVAWMRRILIAVSALAPLQRVRGARIAVEVRAWASVFPSTVRRRGPPPVRVV